VTTPNRDRILIVESDPLISDMIARQALQACGYQTYVIGDANSAIERIKQLKPDLVISNIDLPGLSGKDLMVALSAQGLEVPVIITAKKGEESNIIHAFRVGAVDYLLWPSREAEIINIVERVLKQVHERRDKERLQQQLQQTNQELQMRVRELTTIFSIGKAVTSITDPSLLFERILEGAAKVTQAELGWFMLREENLKTYRMVAQRNLPGSLADRLNQTWDDGLSSLVAMSGETLSIHGEPLKRFKIVALGQAALIVPVKVQKQVMGLLIMMRKQPIPFTSSEQHLLEAVADYASISLVNAELFRTVEERALKLETAADNARTGEKVNQEILGVVKEELRTSIEIAGNSVDRLMKDPAARWTVDNLKFISSIQEQLKNLNRVAEAINQLKEPKDPAQPAAAVNLAGIIRRTAGSFQQLARQNNITLSAEIAADPIQIRADSGQVAQVLNGLISNAIKFCNPGGQVCIRLEKNGDASAHVIVSNTGPGLDPRQNENIFNPSYQPQESRPRRFGGIGIGLSLVKEIVTGQKGKVWVESQPGQGSRFHVTLPLDK
jgi:signal transduction histidine kinase